MRNILYIAFKKVLNPKVSGTRIKKGKALFGLLEQYCLVLSNQFYDNGSTTSSSSLRNLNFCKSYEAVDKLKPITECRDNELYNALSKISDTILLQRANPILVKLASL